MNVNCKKISTMILSIIVIINCIVSNYFLIIITFFRYLRMAKTDQYADIDFEEINDQTGLANDEIKCLKVNKKIYIYKEG